MDTKKVAAVAAAGVIAGAAGLIGATLISDSGGSSNPRVTIFCTNYPVLESSSTYQRWARANPSERDKWLSYRSTICLDQLPEFPLMASTFGRWLVEVGRMALTIDVPPGTTSTTTTTSTAPTTTSTTTSTTTTTTTPPGGAANVFVDSNGGSCQWSAGLDTHAALDTKSCSSLTAANSVAVLGGSIGVEAGSYGGQAISNRPAFSNASPGCDPYGMWGPASTANCVRYFPDGGDVTFTSTIEVHSSAVWFDGTRSGLCISTVTCSTATYDWTVRGRVNIEDSGGNVMDHNVFDGIRANGYLASDDNHTLFRESAFGGTMVSGSGSSCVYVDMASGQMLSNYDESKIIQRTASVPPSNIVFDNDWFHDIDRNNAGADASCHFGGMIWDSGNAITMRNSVMSRLWVYGIEIQTGNGGPSNSPAANVTFENNAFGCQVPSSATNDGDGSDRSSCSGQDTIQTDNPNVNFLIRFNSFSPSGSIGCYATCTYSNFRIVGNVGQAPSEPLCSSSGITWGYNAWVGGICGNTDMTVPDFASLYAGNTVGAEDYHLLNGTNAANNLVSPTGSDYAIPTDIDLQARPVGTNRDAGSDER